MSKIICDICGTSYPESSDSCPICGCSNAAAADLLSDESLYEELEAAKDPVSEPVKKKVIFNYDEVNGVFAPDKEYEDDDDEDDEDDEDEEGDEEDEAPRHNTVVVILLTVLIIALLGAAGFIFFRYFLPNMGGDETVPATTAAVQETETVAPTTEPVIPCQQMVMTNAGVANLNAEGQQFLLHIKALPENTTDKIVYTSADESIATVTEDGKITAASEGETVIQITCGEHFIECPVIVSFVEETVPETTAAIATVPDTTEALTDEDADETEATEATEDAEATEATEATEAEEENSSAAADKNVVLKLKRTDIQLGVYYQFQLVLDCALEPEDVTWTSEHPHIATVDEKGNVTAVKAGTTAITAKYGDQEVECIVRCVGF